MSLLSIGLIGIAALLILFICRMPIAFAMSLVGFLGYAYLGSVGGALSIVTKDMYRTFASYSLTVVPLFIWMGYLAFHMGISRDLYKATSKIVGRVRGGLCMATVGACALFGAICGSTTATTATMGAISIPEMKRYNYDMSLATGTVASGGILGILIPPSVTFILYGVITEQSIGKLFMAGIGTGILLATLYVLTIFILVLRNPNLAPPVGVAVSLKEKLLALGLGGGETVAVFALVMGGLFAGWFTPTEAAGVGVFGMFVVGLISKRFSWQAFTRSLVDTTRISAMVLLLVAGAIIFGHFLALTRIPFELANWVDMLALPRAAVLAFVVVIWLIFGCFVDALALLMLTVPIFYPVAMNLGFDPIWFGAITCLSMAMGGITPPVGMNVYIMKGVAPDVPLETIFKGIFPFLGAIAISIVILYVFPQIVLFLPNLMG